MGVVINRAAVIGAAVLAAALPLRTAHSVGALGHVSVTILPTAGAITGTGPMRFHVAAVGAGGRFVLSPTGNLTGSARGLSTARPGAFTILGPPNAAVVISFSTDGKVIGPGPAMLLGAFTHNAGPSPCLGSDGSLTLAVGATVMVGAGQPAGTYAGRYAVIVNY